MKKKVGDKGLEEPQCWAEPTSIIQNIWIFLKKYRNGGKKKRKANKLIPNLGYTIFVLL